MLKRQKIIAAILAMVLLGGCSESGKAKTPDSASEPPVYTTEAAQNLQEKSAATFSSASDLEMAEAENEQDDALAREDAEAEVPESPENEQQSQPGAPPAQTNPEPVAQPEQQETAGIPVQEPEPTPPAAEITIVTQQPEPAPQPEPEPPAPVPEPTPAPAPAPAPAFDVSACVQNVMNYGVGIGLTLDSTATACWDNPTRANAQSLYAERDLCGLLDWYKASGFTAFWVWAEADGNGGYLVYIGYAS